jgi:hypothetical protein
VPNEGHTSWLKLATSQSAVIDLVGAQDDSMAMGAHQAFPKITNEEERLCDVMIPAYLTRREEYATVHHRQ